MVVKAVILAGTQEANAGGLPRVWSQLVLPIRFQANQDFGVISCLKTNGKKTTEG